MRRAEAYKGTKKQSDKSQPPSPSQPIRSATISTSPTYKTNSNSSSGSSGGKKYYQLTNYGNPNTTTTTTTNSDYSNNNNNNAINEGAGNASISALQNNINIGKSLSIDSSLDTAEGPSKKGRARSHSNHGRSSSASSAPATPSGPSLGGISVTFFLSFFFSLICCSDGVD